MSQYPQSTYILLFYLFNLLKKRFIAKPKAFTMHFIYTHNHQAQNFLTNLLPQVYQCYE